MLTVAEQIYGRGPASFYSGPSVGCSSIEDLSQEQSCKLA